MIGNVHENAPAASYAPFFCQGRLDADAIPGLIKSFTSKGLVVHLDERSSIVLFSEMEDALLWDLMYS